MRVEPHHHFKLQAVVPRTPHPPSIPPRKGGKENGTRASAGSRRLPVRNPPGSGYPCKKHGRFFGAPYAPDSLVKERRVRLLRAGPCRPGVRHPGRHGPARFGLASKQTRVGTVVTIHRPPAGVGFSTRRHRASDGTHSGGSGGRRRAVGLHSDSPASKATRHFVIKELKPSPTWHPRGGHAQTLATFILSAGWFAAGEVAGKPCARSRYESTSYSCRANA